MCLWPNTNTHFALTLLPPSFIIQFTSFPWPMLILLQPLVVCPSPISRIFSSLYVPMPSALYPSKVLLLVIIGTLKPNRATSTSSTQLSQRRNVCQLSPGRFTFGWP
ncbi:hypothetical protein niasHT_033864 [Heterodera trifolii]|uniref:Uncharacterized protein n=1 Tax=Heterodera trifolii TaxID=157864 RepID=A0ABD2IBS8_9BILA